MDVTGLLAELMVSDVTVPEPVLAVGRLSLMDWLAVGIAGQQEPVAQVIRRFADAEGGVAQARFFGGGQGPVRMAALVNGTVSHALDYDDTHFAHIGHPSVAVFPAAMAVAEAEGTHVDRMIEAAVIGMEASIRFGVYLGRDHYQTGFHMTATAGAVGACIAAGRLMGLTAAQGRAALSLLATRASGLKSMFGTMGKPYNAGIAASNGVEVALLVRLGMDAPADALSTEQGFGPTHHGAGDVGAFEGIGQHWLWPDVSHKFHACCHGLHAVLEAAGSLGRVDGAITAIRVWTHPRWMSVCNQTAPMTGLGAKFSYGTVLAMHFLGHDTARLQSYCNAVACDADVASLRSRVAVTADHSLSEMQARLVIELAGGDRLEAFHDLDVTPPLAERAARIRSKAQALVGAERVARMAETINRGQEVSAIAALM